MRGIGVGSIRRGSLRTGRFRDAVTVFDVVALAPCRSGASRDCDNAAIAQARPVVGGPSGPMFLFQIAAIRPKSIGPEGPPTRALAQAHRSRISSGHKKAPRPRGRRARFESAEPARAPAPLIALSRARPTATGAAPRPKRSGSPGSSAPPVRSASPG
ncbi:DUF6053 domain-containing protein [Lysobacter enzymogenes]|uniref:DUF6053 domain-containing protein n=1 Tax=Lysobacter enzymogenes TaxID=69 RepID=UPI003D18C8EE